MLGLVLAAVLQRFDGEVSANVQRHVVGRQLRALQGRVVAALDLEPVFYKNHSLLEQALYSKHEFNYNKK